MVAQVRVQVQIEDVAEHLKVAAFIRKWGLSHSDAANVFRVHYNTVSRWLLGERKPDAGYVLSAELYDQLWSITGKPKYLG